MTKLTPCASAWRQAGALAEIAGHRIFVRERPGNGERMAAPFAARLSVELVRLAPRLDVLPAHRLVAFDFLG